jgi:hypothetical protein
MPTLPQPGNRPARGHRNRELQLWTDFFGTGSCLRSLCAQARVGRGAAPRILASVRLGRIGFRPLPGEPKKGFRPPRGSARARLVREPGARGEASTTGNGGATSPGAMSFFGTASCRVQAATARSSDRQMGPPPRSSPARARGFGPAAHGRCIGAERSLVKRRQLVFGFFLPTSPRRSALGCDRCGEKDLEGEQSPWKDRVIHGRQRSGSARTRRRSNASKSTWWSRGARGGVPATARFFGSSGGIANDKGATATVTWCGCWRGCLRGV